MADLSALSDEELRKLYQQPKQVPIATASDADLQAMLAALPPERPTGERILRAAEQIPAGLKESISTTVGALPDMVGAGMRAVGLPSSSPGQYTDWARKGVNAVTSLGGMLSDPRPPETTLERALYGGAKGVGDAASVLIPSTMVAQGARAGSMTQQLAGALAAQPATQMVSGAAGGAVGEATGSPTLGLAASLAAPLAMGGAARLAQPIRPNQPPEVQRLIQEAKNEGLIMSPGQETGSKPLKKMEQMLSQMPFTSGPQDQINQRAREAFTRASLSKSETPGSFATPDVINDSLAKWGGQIGDIADRNIMQVTPDVLSKLQGIQGTLQYMPPEAARPVAARLKQFEDMLVVPPHGGPNITMLGTSYRMLDTQLGKSIKNNPGDVADGLRELRTTLRSAMDDSISAADKVDWDRARRNYANIKVTEKAMGGAGEAAATGNVPPLALRGALAKSLKEGGYARGLGDQNDLARIGQSMLRPPPDSGTPAGNLMQSPLHAALMGAIGRPIQALYNTDAARTYLTEGVPALAGMVRNAPQMDSPLVAALLGAHAKDVLPGPRR